MAIWIAEIKELGKLYESLKGQFPDLEKELERLIKADDENMVLLYSRRCLEVIITDLCECELKRDRKTEPLKGIIDKLHKEGKVPSHIISSMYGLNELSTYGAHPKDFDPRQVKTTLINLETVADWYLKYKGIEIKADEEEKLHLRGESFKEVRKETGIEEKEKPVGLIKHKLLSGVLITTILVIAAIFAYPKIFKKHKLENLRAKGRISIAVMPFQNMTNDTIWNVWQDGIQDNLITSLSNSEELEVRQTQSITGLLQSKGLTNYASLTPSVAGKLSQILDANVFIHGSIKQSGTTIRINAQLFDSETEAIYKSFQLDGSAGNILNIIDLLSWMVKNFLIISEIEKELPLDYQHYASTNSPEAYRFFIYGQNAFFKSDNSTAVKMYSQAMAIDSNFTFAAIMLPFAYRNQGLNELAKKGCLQIYKKRDQMTLVQKIYMNWLYATFFETPYEAIKYLMQLIVLDDQSPTLHFGLCTNYIRLHQYDKAIPEAEKGLDIYRKWNSKPSTVWAYTSLGLAYHETGQYNKEKALYKKAETDFTDNHLLIQRQAILSLTEGDTIVANQFIQKYKSIRRDNSVPEANIITGLANIYSDAKVQDKAEKYFREALALEPESPLMKSNLSWFIIENDLNIQEGEGLIDKALESNPDNSRFLDIKGRYLFKQGKFKEALKVLEKSWELKPFYDHEIYLHLEAAKKAVANQKNN